MRDIFVALVVFGLLPKILSRPDIGILLWSWLAYMNPHKLTWGFAHDFPFAQLVALATLGGLMVWKEPKRIPLNPVTVLLIIFTLWMFFTTLFAYNQEGAWVKWNTVWKVQLMTFVMMMIMTTKWRIQANIWVIGLSLGFYGIKGGLFTVLTGGGYRVWGPAGTFIGGNNEIGLALIMVIPLLRYLQLIAEKKWQQNAMGISILLNMLAIVGTQSRGALVGMAAMLFFLVLKSRKKAVLILVLVVSVPALIAFMPQSWHDRMHTIKTYEQDASAMGRINAWYTAFHVANDRVTGGGFKCLHMPLIFKLYAPNPDDLHDAHSHYFEVLGEHGYIGLVLFLVLGLSVWKLATHVIKQAKNSEEFRWITDLCSMIQVSLVGYAVSGLFLGLATFDLYYNLIAMVVACKIYLERNPQTIMQAAQTPTLERRPASFVRPVINPKYPVPSR